MESRKKSDLKRCPFCGFKGVRLIRYPRDGVHLYSDRYAVLCDWRDGGCGAEGGLRKSADEAKEVWNQRKRKWR